MKEITVHYQYLMKGSLTVYAENELEAQETVAGLVMSASPADLDDQQSDLRITKVDTIRDKVSEDEYCIEAI